jgi:WD40 repeat protein
VLPGLRGMTAVAFSPDGEQLAVAAQGAETVELWNPRTVERLVTCDVKGGTVAQVAYHPRGELVAAACKISGRPGEVRVWKTDTGELVATFDGHGNGAERLAFSPDGARLLTVSGDSVATVWEVSTGRRLMAAVADYKGPFIDTDAVFALGGTRVAYRSPQLWDAATGDAVAKLRSQGHVTCLATSLDGRVLATGVAYGTVYLQDCGTGSRLSVLTGHTDRVRSIAFSADGARVLTASLDGTARLWDAGSGEQIRLFSGHESGVELAIFGPDGRRIVTSATDGTIRIWNADRGQELCTLTGQRDYPRAFALSPDGTCLVAAATDGSIRIWGLSNAAVTRTRAASAAASGGEAPRAHRETPPDRRDPAG